MLTSYEMLLKDKGVFKSFSRGGKYPEFMTVIVDEAHRLKGLQSSTREIIRTMETRWLLLLTGSSPPPPNPTPWGLPLAPWLLPALWLLLPPQVHHLVHPPLPSNLLYHSHFFLVHQSV